MLLRRIIEHVKAQNWVALVLDFFIVVLGVGVALVGEQWLSDQGKRHQLEIAEMHLRRDLSNTYVYFKERIATTECRVRDTRFLLELLTEKVDKWPGVKGANGSSNPPIWPNFPVYPGLYRHWSNQTWEAELARGTFDEMDVERRSQYARHFEMVKVVGQLQEEIDKTVHGLLPLAFEFDIGPSDRLRYLDKLAEYHRTSELVEVAAAQAIEQVEKSGNSVLFLESAELREEVANVNRYLAEYRPDCTSPIVIPFIDDDS